MIDYEALFKITYGLYIVCSGDKKDGNGYIANTVFQITSDPPRFAVSCNKDNLTHQYIEKYGCFTVSILHDKTESDLFGKFGYKSGSDIKKLKNTQVNYGITGAPIVLDDCVAYMEFKVTDKWSIDTHTVFIGELIEAHMVNDNLTPITYAYYREVKKGLSPKNAPTYIDKSKIKEKPQKETLPKHQCSACGYIYDENEEGTPFKDLTDDWMCPICGADKEDFFEV